MSSSLSSFTDKMVNFTQKKTPKGRIPKKPSSEMPYISNHELYSLVAQVWLCFTLDNLTKNL